jgi:DNA-binding GntR family transcriptional regulator
LVAEGLIVRRRGAGSFVSSHPSRPPRQLPAAPIGSMARATGSPNYEKRSPRTPPRCAVPGHRLIK